MNKSLFEVLKFKLNFTNRSSPIFPPNPKSADQLIRQLPRTSCHMLTLHSSPHSLKYTIPPPPIHNQTSSGKSISRDSAKRFKTRAHTSFHRRVPTQTELKSCQLNPVTCGRSVWQCRQLCWQRRGRFPNTCQNAGWRCKVARENSVGEGREWWLRRAGIGRVVVNIGWKCLWRENDRKFERWERCSLVENYGKQGCQLARTLWIVVKSLETSDMVQCFFSENLYFS